MSHGRCAAVEALAQGNTLSRSFVMKRNSKFNIGSPASVCAAVQTHTHTHVMCSETRSAGYSSKSRGTSRYAVSVELHHIYI